ncbi:transglycosylase SLT domain-containing protein [Oceanibaculum pacificum]|uniref:Transglycosylase SLT domain-containing protein n=1 Tax=Oceanibaculum pacificum TaxID=580166 RepID=A0A154WH68_9PROT|nr:transglycosylase SLT domain-containing protein [Oceanibaculum pacificum]KZD12857.1 hypothetical protein AUP43_00520 [Oceanibaculum pacificum]
MAASISITAHAADTISIETAFLSPGAIDKVPPQRAQSLPAVLGQSDVLLYRRIFSLQELGQWAAADREIAKLKNKVLMGHVLYQRYMHPTAYRSSYEELRRWMEAYADHPEAVRVYGLAVKRKPAGAAAPVEPVAGFLAGNGEEASAVFDRINVNARAAALTRNKSAADDFRRISELVRKGQPTAALKLLDGELKAKAGPLAFAVAQGEVAAGYYLAGDNEQALTLAREALRRTDEEGTMAAWIGGLSAWRLNKHDEASRLFERVAMDSSNSGWTVSAGAYWASRAHLVSRRPAEATRWLARAATFPTTFYGLLARRALGVETPVNWTEPTLSEADIRNFLAMPNARRALALVQLDMIDMAELELRKLYPKLDSSQGPALLAMAGRASMAGLAMRLASRLQTESGERYTIGLFPMPHWEPPEGFTVDRALLFSIMRQESGFDARAKSGSGAHGLMQLMPQTARFIATDAEYTGDRSDLLDPKLNLTLGQRYVQHLLDHAPFNGNLFLVVSSYNAGPGNVGRWLKEVDHRDDPLLFIESMPSRETRMFVERVVANFWTYRMRLGQPSPSLEQVASGQWPMYESFETLKDNAAQAQPASLSR